MMPMLTRLAFLVKSVYSWPPGPGVLLTYAGIATLVLLLSVFSSVWLFAVLFWPTLWIMRAVISLLSKIPSAQRRRNEERNLR